MAFDQTAAQAILKETFTDKAIQKLINDENVNFLWRRLAKKQRNMINASKGVHNPFGKSFSIPIHTDENETISNSLTTAETKAATSGQGGEQVFKTFEVSPVVLYAAAGVSGVTASTADGRDDGSFIDAMKTEYEGAVRGMGRHMGVGAHRAGYAEVGQIAAGSTVTTTTIDIRAGDRANIRIGMDLRANGTSLTTVVRSGTFRVTQTALLSSGNVRLTLSGDPSAVSWAAGDFLFNANIVSTANPKIRTTHLGLAAYNPVTAPAGGTTIHGVDISTNYRLSGLRNVATDFTDPLEAVNSLLLDMVTEGQKPNLLIANQEVWKTLFDLIPQSSLFKGDQGQGITGFETVKFFAPGVGAIELALDPQAEPGEVRAVDERRVFWAYNKELVHVIDEDGLFFRKLTGDNFGCALRSIAALCCDNPLGLGVTSAVA